MQVKGVSDNTYALSGELHGADLLRAREALESAIVENGRSTVIDLSGVETVNSQVLSLCLCLVRKASSEKVDLRFDNPPAKLYDMARVGGIEFLLGVQP